MHNISLNSNDTERCIVVYITDDAIPEKNETFIITLSLLGDGAVTLNPQQATIVVQDNDRKWIGNCNVLCWHYVIWSTPLSAVTVGFDNVSFTATESDGSRYLHACFGITQAWVGKPFIPHSTSISIADAWILFQLHMTICLNVNVIKWILHPDILHQLAITNECCYTLLGYPIKFVLSLYRAAVYKILLCISQNCNSAKL